MRIEDMEILALGALLHDIGKFAQRTGKRESSRKLEGEYCPIYKGHPSHTHVLYTDHFIEKDLPLPPGLLKHKSRLARLASAHHKPGQNDLMEMAISRADSLSAGMDRAGDGQGEGGYKTARLISTFSQISLKRKKSPPPTQFAYYPLNSLDGYIFPVSLEEARKTGYDDLFGAFLNALGRIPLDMGTRHYMSSLAGVLEKFTWCIPSSTYKSDPDVSLYDHSLTTAAIAQALAIYHQEAQGLPGKDHLSKGKFILFGGDISGIQSYIFGVEKSHGAGVAKILRARSFHLQALTHSVVIDFLDRADLLFTARIMDAGGRFVLLLPNAQKIRTLLPQFTAEVQEWFFREFKGRLSLNLAEGIVLREDDFKLEIFKDKIGELYDQLETAKLQKFDLLLRTGRSPIAETEDFTEGLCAVCRVNPAAPKAMNKHANRPDEDFTAKCAQCQEQIDVIGRLLPQNEIAWAVFNKDGAGVKLFNNIGMQLKENVQVNDASALDILNLRGRGAYTSHPVAGYLPVFSEDDEKRWRREKREQEEDEPVENGKPKTFGHLAEEARIAHAGGLRGKAMLAAFKADVDNLGMIFSLGLGERMTVSRFAGLSRMLNIFFAEYMIGLVKKEYPNMYVVYAGGDDVFLLGPWHQVADFAQTLATRFQEYNASNADISLSAGIFVCKPSLPAHRMAEEAERLLSDAKAFKRSNGGTKNAVRLFGITVSWEAYPELLKQGTWLEQLILTEAIPKGLANRLLTYADTCRAFLAGNINIRDGLYVSQMRYDFTRNLKHKQIESKDKEDLDALVTDPEKLRNMRLPISYALYRTRTD